VHSEVLDDWCTVVDRKSKERGSEYQVAAEFVSSRHTEFHIRFCIFRISESDSIGIFKVPEGKSSRLFFMDAMDRQIAPDQRATILLVMILHFGLFFFLLGLIISTLSAIQGIRRLHEWLTTPLQILLELEDTKAVYAPSAPSAPNQYKAPQASSCDASTQTTMSPEFIERIMNGTWKSRDANMNINAISTGRVKIELQDGE
jgi:hypothetical protein